ncbi:SpoIIE family protein phosphatase [Actinoplanes aureus]|uniref:SpoIIE family protein phosphatase n=1 Tax=Actinoplanes aureus TaxID=2792083 RepID=A0A931C9G8_9ACTN|nr:SpoIIE family protein phosphatase [Actinoplanes aureus]MBG0560800.1 SpoIIE family protein phosphatase [Actinoplanes aureus]
MVLPTPLLIRDATARPVPLPANRPFGVLRHRPYREAQIALQPGDRLVMVTDGMLERGAALDLPVRMQQLSGQHPREVVRVLDVAGPTLSDDACLLVLDWHGGHGTIRHTAADLHRSSTPATAAA